jgi:hypothetical protein
LPGSGRSGRVVAGGPVVGAAVGELAAEHLDLQLHDRHGRV